MKLENWAGLAVGGIIVYGAYRIFKSVQSLNPLDALENAVESVKVAVTEGARRIENPLNIQQPPTYAFDFTGLNPEATTQRLVPSFDFTQPTTRTELTTAPLFQGAGMGSNQTISTQPPISDYSFGVNTGTDLHSQYADYEVMPLNKNWLSALV